MQSIFYVKGESGAKCRSSEIKILMSAFKAKVCKKKIIIVTSLHVWQIKL